MSTSIYNDIHCNQNYNAIINGFVMLLIFVILLIFVVGIEVLAQAARAAHHPGPVLAAEQPAAEVGAARL